jgi:hypothetical protein
VAKTAVTVKATGFFFTGNPVGWVHMSIYDALEDVMDVGASAAATQLTPGHGLLTGELQASITPRLAKASRGTIFKGRANVWQGVRGYEPVRRYGSKIERKYHYLSRAARAAESYANGHAGAYASACAKGLER